MEGISSFFAGCLMSFFLLLMLWFMVNPYKQGQIDAMTGNIKYELKLQPDSTKIWVKRN